MKIIEWILEAIMSIIVSVIFIAAIIACLYGFIILTANTIAGFVTLVEHGEITSQLIIPIIIVGAIAGIACFIFVCVLEDK